MPPRPILVPTDFSAPAAEALAYARRVAGATGAPLHVLHAVSWPDAGPFEVPGEAPTAAQEVAEENALAHAALAEAVGDAEATLVVRHSNVPAFEVRDYARTADVGLVVMGARGRRRPEWRGGDLVLGSVAAEVIQTAPCDVLLVPYRPDSPFSARPPRRVLVPVDFSSASRPLAAFGLGLARDLGADGVDLVHVLEPLPHPFRWVDETLVDVVPEIRERAAAALRKLADEVGAGVEGEPPVALYVERGKAARTIPRVAQALGADLVVVGPHAERPVFDRLLGSVAEGVARRAACPVLIARESAAPEAHDDEVDVRSYLPEEDT